MRRAVVAAVAILCTATAARATWSIIIIDTRTNEIAFGSATCLTGFDLQFNLPVVRVGKGAAAAQSFVDFTATNRRLIWDALRDGVDPPTILDMLRAQDPSHETRQYVIVDTQGRAVTFSGNQNGAFANGLTGQTGTLVYGIAGNVITGQPVLDMAETAILTTPGGLPEKVMAAMEAARAMGGDGRCSCNPNNPPGCGSPPPNFTKAAHIAFLIDSRPGDTLGTCQRTTGCANGGYYMNFNVAFQNANDPDPVIQLRQLFDAWRTGLIGVPDAIESRHGISPAAILADGSMTATLNIELLDWQGNPATDVTGVMVAHGGNSAGSTQIGTPVDLGDGRFSVELTAGTIIGIDRLRTTAIHANGQALLPGAATVAVTRRGDMNADTVLDAFDIEPFVTALLDPGAYVLQYPDVPFEVLGDMNEDGAFDTFDIEGFIDALIGP
jgi:hypothetical protein